MTPEEIRELLDKVERKEAKERKELRERLRRQEKEQRAFVKKAVSGKTDTEPIADARPTESTNVELSPVEGDSKEVLKDRLRLCKQVAKEEIEVSEKAILELQKLVSHLRQDLNALTTYGVISSPVPSHFLTLVPKLREMSARGVLVSEVQEEIHRITKRICSQAETIVAGEKAALKRKRETLSHFTVTLFGRTMTGKSTFREAITGGDGATIGKGAQRTTRDVRFYDWNGLRIVDTPGIGAYKGEVDRRKAFSIVGETDVILYLTTTDGVQETSFEALKALRDRGKPILFVINVKRDLSKSKVYRRRFIRNAEQMIGEEATGGHRERIRELSREHLGIENPVIFAIHAQAAHLATQSEYANIAKQLHTASGVDELFDGLTTELIQRGAQRRVQCISGGTALGISKFTDFLSTEHRSLSSQKKYLKNKHQDLKRRIDRHVNQVNNTTIPTTISGLLQPLRNQVSGFVDNNLHNKGVEDLWKELVRSLDLKNSLIRKQKNLVLEAETIINNFDHEISAEHRASNVFITGPSYFNPLPIREALEIISGLLRGFAFMPKVLLVKIGLDLICTEIERKDFKVKRKKRLLVKSILYDISRSEKKLIKRIIIWNRDNITEPIRVKILDKMYTRMHTVKDVAQRIQSCQAEAERLESGIREHISDRSFTLNSPNTF